MRRTIDNIFRSVCLALLLGCSLIGTAFGQAVGPTSPLDNPKAGCALKKESDGVSTLNCSVPVEKGFLQFCITYEGDAYSTIYTPSFPRNAPANQVFQGKAATKAEIVLPPPIYDVAHYTAASLATYRAMGFKPRNETMQIRVTQEDGGTHYGFNSYHNQETGVVTLNLKWLYHGREMHYTLAHEIFHEMQHTNLPPEGTSSMQRRWFTEATAEYGAYLATGQFGTQNRRPPATYFQKSILKYQQPAGLFILSKLLNEYGEKNHEYLGANFIKYLVERGAVRGDQDGNTYSKRTYFAALWNAVTKDARKSDFSDSDVPGRINAFLLAKHGKKVTFTDEYIHYVVQQMFQEDYLLLPKGYQELLQDDVTLAEDESEASVTVDCDDALSAQVSALTVAGTDQSRRVSVMIETTLEDGMQVYAHVGTSLKATTTLTQLRSAVAWTVEVKPGEQIFLLAVNGSDTNNNPDAIVVNIDADVDKERDLDRLIKQLENLALQFDVTVTPEDNQGPYTLVATIDKDVELRQGRTLREIREIIRQLNCTPVIEVVDSWTGPSESSDGTFEVEKPDDYRITLARRIIVSATGGRRAAKLKGEANVPAVSETVTAGIAVAPENIAGAWAGNLVIVRMPLVEGLDQTAPNDDLMVQACAAALGRLTAYKGKELTLKVKLTPQNASNGKMAMSITLPKQPGESAGAGSAQELTYRLDNGILTATMQQEGQLMTMTGRFTPIKAGKQIKGWTLSGSWRLYGVSKTERVEAMGGTWTVSRQGGR